MMSTTRVVFSVHPRRRCAAVPVALALGLVLCPGLPAQGTQPLRKADLVRLLTAGGMGTSEIAALVRRNCLAFQPTARDHTDLQAAGADAAVLSAVDQCAGRRAAGRGAGAVGRAGGAGGGGGGGGGPARSGLRVVTERNVAAEAGTDLELRVQLLQGRAPQSRVPLVLKGSGAIPGGLTQDARAFTDARGVATFHVLAGSAAGPHRLTVAFANGAPVGPAGDIQLTTTAVARELRATVVPGELELREGTGAAGVVGVTVRDVRGNPVARVPLQLAPVTATLAGVVPARTTDERGQTAFTLAPQEVRREGEVGVFSGGARLGSIIVRLRPIVLSEQRTRFVPGPEQRGVVGSPLAQLLVLEVRDTSGPPVAGQAVSFTAAGARVEPAVVSTDSSGVARVRVNFGERAGPVVVTAKVRTITRSVTLTADPGPARELAVSYDSARVKGPVALRSRKPVALHVVAHDSYGNETPLANFVAVATGPEIHLNAATVSGSEGLVTLEARRRGSADVEVQGAGLVTRVPVQVTLPAAAQGWVLGARGSWTGFTYAFGPLPNIRGRPGVRAEFFAGRAFTPQLRAELVGSIGALNADTASVERSVNLKQAYLRAEYTFATEAQVTPVMSLGGGFFRILSNDPRHFVYHSSLFWLIGAGADITVSPRVVGEVRVETQQLNEMTSSIVNGHVGALTIVEGGVRLSL